MRSEFRLQGLERSDFDLKIVWINGPESNFLVRLHNPVHRHATRAGTRRFLPNARDRFEVRDPYGVTTYFPDHPMNRIKEERTRKEELAGM